MEETYDAKIKRVTREVLIQGYHQSGKKRITTGMRIEDVLRKEFPEGAKNTEQQVQLDSEQKQGAFDNPVDARTALGITRIQRTRTGKVLRH